MNAELTIVLHSPAAPQSAQQLFSGSFTNSRSVFLFFSRFAIGEMLLNTKIVVQTFNSLIRFFTRWLSRRVRFRGIFHSATQNCCAPVASDSKLVCASAAKRCGLSCWTRGLPQAFSKTPLRVHFLAKTTNPELHLRYVIYLIIH